MATPTAEEAMRLALELWRAENPDIARLWSNMGRNAYLEDHFYWFRSNYMKAARTYQTGCFEPEWDTSRYRRQTVPTWHHGKLTENRIQAYYSELSYKEIARYLNGDFADDTGN